MKRLTEKLILEEPTDEIKIEDNTNIEEPTQIEEVPQEVVDNAYGNLISNTISREWDDINSYKDLVAQFVSEQKYPEVVDILNQLIDDKTISIGMLTKVLELINGTEQNDLMQQGIDKAEEVISDNATKEEEVVEESLTEGSAWNQKLKDVYKILDDNDLRFNVEENIFEFNDEEDREKAYKLLKDKYDLGTNGLFKLIVEIDENLEEANANYVWKKCGDDWCLVIKGKEPKEDGNNLVELSRMNKYFPWTIYVKGKEKKNLDLPSDNINDIKKYIIDNIDKILDKKLKEAKVDYVKKDTYGKYGTEVTIYSCEGDENTKKGFTATVNGKSLEADTLEELEKQIIDAVNGEDKKADTTILNDSLNEEDSKKKELPKGKMITNGKGISYYRQGNKYYSNTGWLEREISKEEFDREVEKAFKELDEDLDDYTNRWTNLARKSAMDDNKIDYEELYNDDEKQYKYIESKLVEDSDGFVTDYTMYFDNINNKYVFVFGDYDLYTPEDGDFDYECETAQEAREWFDNYKGFAEKDVEESFEDDEDEIKPFTYQETFDEIRSDTNNFTQDFEGVYAFRNEWENAIKICNRKYNDVDFYTEDNTFKVIKNDLQYHIIAKEPKNKK